jgi:hypothetical protein
MEEITLTAAHEVTVADLAKTLNELDSSRLPDFVSWLPGGNIWLYSVPVIILLLLWLLYPVALILIVCAIVWLIWLF